MNIFRPDVDRSKYIVATYHIKCRGTLAEGAFALAVGQSIGNPTVRNQWETDDLIDNHACMILHDHEELGREGMTVSLSQGIVQIGFPVININVRSDGISQLMCQLMGGQMDIDSIVGCRLIDIEFPKDVINEFELPRFGIGGIRKFTGVLDRPLLGGIVKPKTGLTPNQLLTMVMQMVEGGVDFIKEDEIMASPYFCPLEKRVPLISQWLRDNAPQVIYAFSITGDHEAVLNRALFVSQYGGTGVHINVWNGLGVYKAVRQLHEPIFLFFQKSGDKVFTDPDHKFGIDWKVICKLAGLSGVDFIHAGMWGGYMHNDEMELNEILSILRSRNVMPSLSCGMNPQLVKPITEKFGVDYMATVGGYIHGHEEGTVAGAQAMRQAIDELF
jgi:ribulose-bisphosphate carboxylase large chain